MVVPDVPPQALTVFQANDHFISNYDCLTGTVHCNSLLTQHNLYSTLLISFIGSLMLVIGGVRSSLRHSHPTNHENLIRILFHFIQLNGILVMVYGFFEYYKDATVWLPFLQIPRLANKFAANQLSTATSNNDSFITAHILFVSVLPITVALLGGLSARLGIFYFFRTRALSAGLRDIGDMELLFTSMQAFDPLSYIDLSQGVFVGLQNSHNPQSPQNILDPKSDQQLAKPLYVPWLLFQETHAQILGSTGSGKGIALGVLGYQFALKRESLIVFDPKGDGRLPLVLSQGALKSGAEFIYLDLQAHAVSQFNLLEGASDLEIEELLVAGLGLQPSSGEGNYYRGIDQDAAEQVSKLALQGSFSQAVTLPRLLEIAQSHKQLSKADNFVRRLRQVCDLRVIQTAHNIGLKEHIQKGSVIYIRGSTDNHRVKMLQTMLLIRILQIVKSRISLKLSAHTLPVKPVCLILDEFKHLLSPVALDMLGVVRELGCHALLAHQSLADLAGCPGLERKDVEPVVVDNATLKLIFRIGDDQAAKGFANKSGQERTYKESIRPGPGTLDAQKSWTEIQHPRMSADLFLHLHRPSQASSPFTAGVLFGLGLAKLFSLSPIVVSGSLLQPTESPRNLRSAPKEPGELI